MVKFEGKGQIAARMYNGKNYFDLLFVGGKVGLSVQAGLELLPFAGTEVRISGTVRQGKTGLFLSVEKVF